MCANAKIQSRDRVLKCQVTNTRKVYHNFLLSVIACQVSFSTSHRKKIKQMLPGVPRYLKTKVCILCPGHTFGNIISGQLVHDRCSAREWSCFNMLASLSFFWSLFYSHKILNIQKLLNLITKWNQYYPPYIFLKKLPYCISRLWKG